MNSNGKSNIKKKDSENKKPIRKSSKSQKKGELKRSQSPKIMTLITNSIKNNSNTK